MDDEQMCGPDGPDVIIDGPEEFAATSVQQLEDDREHWLRIGERMRQNLAEGAPLVWNMTTRETRHAADVAEESDIFAWFLQGEIERRREQEVTP